MRVLMLSKACLVGIYQRKLEAIAQHLDIAALQVLVPPFWKDERGIMPLERAYTQGYDLIETPIRFNGNFHLHYFPRFRQAVEAFRPDVIHIDEEPYNLATWQALRIAKQHAAATLFFSWQNIVRDYPIPFRQGERWVLHNIDHALMGTESAAQVWLEKGYHGAYTVVPQFGVDTELFQPRQPSASDVFTVGYIGRLVPEKGVDLLLHALAKLQNPRWRLMLVGGGTEDANLQSLAKTLGIDDRVTFIGQVPSLEMAAHYQQLDVLVLPSRTMPNWKEQFGRVLIEAMASGVVVVGSDSGAIPDVIGEAGMVFPEDDAIALHTCLEALQNDPTKRHALMQRGIQRVRDHFTQAQVAEKHVSAYQQALESKRAT